MSSSHSPLRFLWLLIALFLNLRRSPVSAYIPALPINGTGPGPTSGSQASVLEIEWAGGQYQSEVSYQLERTGSNGTSKGAFVHFSEEGLSPGLTTTPWIALVSCDANATDASQTIDIFSLALQRGAQAALLYSQFSDRCQLSAAFADPKNFDQVIDIYATSSLSSSQLIESQFKTINASQFGDYDPQLLNASATQINATIQSGTISPGFLFATISQTAINSANSSVSTPSGEGGGSGQGQTNGGIHLGVSSSALYVGLAMIFAVFHSVW